MNLKRSIFTATPLAALAALVFAAPAAAQDRPLFVWSGKVDREVVLVMRGPDVQVRASGADASYRPRLERRSALPRTEGIVTAHLANGRGSIEVIQQPSAQNDYSTVVRISDPRAGADDYRVVTTWRAARGDVFERDRRDRDDDWDDDDRYEDRARDRDGSWHWHENDRKKGKKPKKDKSRKAGKGPNHDMDRGRERDRRDDRDRDRSDRRNDTGLMRWNGEVDAVTEIRISGRRVEHVIRSGAAVRGVRTDIRGDGLPRSEVRVAVGLNQGRGHVAVVQQPSRSNNYTAVVRVTDPQAGYGLYDFNLTWQAR